MARPAGLRQRRLRAHAERQDHQVGGDGRVPVRTHGESVTVRLDLPEALAEPEPDALLAEMPRDLGGHLRVERRHDLRQLLDHRDDEPAAHEVLGHLEPDEAAADHDRPRRGGVLEPRADAAGVGDGAHDEDAGEIEAAGDGADRRRPRREHKHVVPLVALGAARGGP